MIQLLHLQNFMESYMSGLILFEPLINSWLYVFFAAFLLSFLIGEITKNYSQVDKLWSIMPLIYSILALSYSPGSPRLWVMTLLVIIWGFRLSYNFYRKGGYQFPPWKGDEDYRWAVLRKNPMLKGFRYSLFNLFFISFFQHFLIMLFSTPLLLAVSEPESPLNAIDLLAAGAMLLFIAIETVSDNQLFDFHEQKKGRRLPNGKYTQSLAAGFMVEGMWKSVRHPNYIAEQMIWFSFYFFGVAASGQILNWTIFGPVLLVLLFIGSSSFTENISLSKYPAYVGYKERVPRYLPFFFKGKEENKTAYK